MKPSILIGSSVQALPIAEKLAAYLNTAELPKQDRRVPSSIEAHVWNEDPLFVEGERTRASLRKATRDFDFAVMIFSAEDQLAADNPLSTPRDNLIFEAGLFAGALGFERLFIVVPRVPPATLPSDLARFTHTHYCTRHDGAIDVSEAGQKIASAVLKQGVFHHRAIEPEIEAIVAHARSAFGIEHPLFHNHLTTWCQRAQEHTRHWPEGSFVIEANANWLANAFSEAKKNIFSTTVPAFMKVWRSPAGRNLLQLQTQLRQECNVHSTRVFVFGAKTGVSADDDRVMREHLAAGVDVRIFYNEENAFDWTPNEINKDFTFIDDGDIIGITEIVDQKYRARWHFHSDLKRKDYTEHVRSLSMNSVPLAAW